MDDEATSAPDGGPIYRTSLLSGTMVTAATYKRLLAAYQALADLVPEDLKDRVAVTGKDVEDVLRRANITPTIEACDAFRIGLARGLADKTIWPGEDNDPKFGGSD